MKTAGFSVIAWSVLASSSFAVIRPPYPQVTAPPETTIVIADDPQDSIHATFEFKIRHQQ